MTSPDLATLSLAGSDLRRQPRVDPRYRPDDYLARFDSHTLWLDAVQGKHAVHLVCPAPNNLWPHLRRAEFSLDGRPVRARFCRYRRHMQVTLPFSDRARVVSVRIADWHGQSAISSDESALFAGANVAMLLSKDNDLVWLEDFVRFHVYHHDLRAVLLFDNGSTKYRPSEVEAALRRGGVGVARVVSVPLPFGPRGKQPFANAELFLQTGLMNVGRLRFLSRARAVLNTDPDELIVTPGTTVFDLARGSLLGMVSFYGSWRYMPANHTAPPRHGAHTRKRPGDKPCPRKWCVVPSGPLRGWQWRTHGPEGFPLTRLTVTGAASYLHCSQISTGWKTKTRLLPAGGTVEDPVACAVMEAAGLT